MKKKYSLIPHDTIHTVKDLTDEEAGQLFKKILYYFNGEDLEVERIPNLMFQTLKPKFDEHNESYNKQIEANRENGKKGGRPKKTENNPSKPKETQKNPWVSEKTPKFSFKAHLINYGFSIELVDQWLQVRKLKKSANTKVAFDKFIR